MVGLDFVLPLPADLFVGLADVAGEVVIEFHGFPAH